MRAKELGFPKLQLELVEIGIVRKSIRVNGEKAVRRWKERFESHFLTFLTKS